MVFGVRGIGQGTVAGNQPPVITSEAITRGTESLLYQYDVEAVDPDDDPLIFSLVVVKDCLPPPSDQVGWWPGDGDATDLITGSAGQEIAVVRKGSDGLIYLNGQLDTKTEER